ncbi:MAG: DUF302 domain-containing protein [Verrucomicrobiales bacterium]
MKIYGLIALLVASPCLHSHGDQKDPSGGSEKAAASEKRYEETDALLAKVSANVSDFETVVTIDHARLAGEEGVVMPPSAVVIYTVAGVNTALMKANPRVGLDLPQKILVFEEKGEPRVSFPTSKFLAARHGITDKEALARYESGMTAGLRGLDPELLAPAGADGVTRDFGIVELVSDFPFKETTDRLKAAVMKQGDTVWFGEVELSAAAAEEGEKIPGATLLLFGGPKPGGVAMAKFPQLGLDAFCQKLLVYENAEGEIRVLFNDIAELAKLHYGKSAKPHEMLNGRLKGTFEGAIVKKGE